MVGVNSCSTTSPFLSQLGQVDKVDIDQSDYQRPELYVDNYTFSKNYRSIASVGSDNLDMTNRQLYFLTYYKQYLTMGHILGKKDTIKSCPSFHHIYLEHKDEMETVSAQYSSQLNFNEVKKDITNIAKYPVLSLPASSGNNLVTELVEDNWRRSGEHVQAALEHYYQIEKQEVELLCDRGVSPGYYVYENLVQYFQTESSFHRTQAGLKAILKLPVMANMLILDNLMRENYALNETNNFEKWLMTRSQLTWFTEYRENLVKKRKTLLSAKY